MHMFKRLDRTLVVVGALALVLAATPAGAQVFVQCPGDTNGNAVEDGGESWPANQQCFHLAAGDGFARMADGSPSYIFSFTDLSGLVSAPTSPTDAQGNTDAQNRVLEAGMLGAAWPAPTIVMYEGAEAYLTLTNVGMMIRPDLFDAHTVHFHGHPNMATVFDGLPESGLSINMGASLSYYYKITEPGTYMYHCHVEATEHMQMGMLGNLYVTPAQDGTPYLYDGKTYSQFVYNDGDGSTGYDRAYPIQLGSFDWDFHNASWTVQPLPFADMKDEYFMINGRGYPDTVRPGAMTEPWEQPIDPETGDDLNGDVNSQEVSSLIEAVAGERILLRVSNLNVTTENTLMSPSIPMTVVGRDAKQLLNPAGDPLYYQTNSVTMGGGMSYDVMLDTTDVAPGTYFLYSSNLYQLANHDESEAGLGGMLTEIVIQ